MKRCILLTSVLALICMGQAAAPARTKPKIADANSVMGDLAEKYPGQKFTHQFVMMPLRDGVKLATDIFLPEGAGPLPTMLLRTPYLRFDSRADLGAPCALVLQNQRGRYGSEGTLPKDSFDNEPDDDYDAIEWIAQQKWCNGKVGMWGPSGHGISASAALWSGAPHLTAVNVNITADDAYLYWCFSNGARRKFYTWMSSRGQKVLDWPRPTTIPYDLKKRQALLAERGPKCRAAFNARAGWFDLFSEGALDEFAAVAANGKAFLSIGPSAHGAIGGGLKYPGAKRPDEVKERTLKQWMTEPDPAGPTQSWLVYYLMGNGQDPNIGYGNIQLASPKWPVDNTPTSYYMHKDGRLSPEAPKEKGASLSYQYDPRDPVPSVGGNYDTGSVNGPYDQRKLKDRKDILRFVSDPLEGPVGVVGKIWVELHVSSDCPDTEFTAKLIDIYPDGYEAVYRASAMLARYHGGLDKPAPLERGKVYKLSMDCWSTALVFNKGHRIAVTVSSSDSPQYEVHPNTYEQVGGMDKARVASNTVHLSADHASKVILPVIPKEWYVK